MLVNTALERFSVRESRPFQYGCLTGRGFLIVSGAIELARMRNEYVTPLHGKLSARTEWLKGEVDATTTTSARNKLQKELATVKKKQVELVAFDDLLRHYADQRINIDLDDGVKVNYGKFRNLRAEVKTVTGE